VPANENNGYAPGIIVPTPQPVNDNDKPFSEEESEADRLEAGARARLADANRTIAHLAALIAARDFRRRGWLLASKNGSPVRSATSLRHGDRLELQLHDGSTEAVVEQVQRHEGAPRHD